MPKSWLLNGRRVNAHVMRTQRGTFTITNATSTSFSINAVDLANSRLRLLGVTADGSTNPVVNNSAVRIDWSGNATILALMNTANATRVFTVSVEVTEYWPGVIQSIQRGTVTFAGATSYTSTVNPVVVNGTDLVLLGWTTTTTSPTTESQPKLVLTNTVTVTIDDGTGTAYAQTVGFELTCWK